MMTAPTPFTGLLHHLRNARDTCHHLDYGLDHQYSWRVSGGATTPDDMTLVEIDRADSVVQVARKKIDRLIQIIVEEHRQLNEDYIKRIDERNRKDPIWREVHGLPPLEE